MARRLTIEIMKSRTKVDPETGCWNYYGVEGTEPIPYARTRVLNEAVSMHRWSYEQHIGPIPDGLDIRHKCDNPCCVNPDHLVPGTHTDNMQDKVAVGTQHHPRGILNVKAKLTDEQVVIIAADPRSPLAVAAEYAITTQTVHDIRSGKTWGHVQKQVVKRTHHLNRKLSPDDAAAVLTDTRPYTQIANQYGISKQTVCNVKNGRFYSDAH